MKNLDIHLRIDPDTKDRLDALVKETGLPASEIIRRMINDKPINPKPQADFLKATNLMANLANNMNQIAVRLNTIGFVDTDELLAARKEVLDTMLELKRIYM